MDNGTLMMNAISYSGDGGTLVMNGKIYSGSGGGGVDLSDTTATQATVLNGYKFHDKDGNLVTGTIPINQIRIIASPTAPALTLEDKYSVVNIEQGYYGLSTRIGLSHEDRLNLIAANIKKDVTILGVTGTFEGGSAIAQGTVTPNSTTDTKVSLDFKPSAVYIMTNMGASTYFGSGIVKTDGTNIGSRYGTGSSPVASSPCVVTLQDDGFLIKSATNRYESLTYYVAIE